MKEITLGDLKNVLPEKKHSSVRDAAGILENCEQVRNETIAQISEIPLSKVLEKVEFNPEDFISMITDLVEQEFPKGKCRERGAALVLVAMINITLKTNFIKCLKVKENRMDIEKQVYLKGKFIKEFDNGNVRISFAPTLGKREFPIFEINIPKDAFVSEVEADFLSTIDKQQKLIEELEERNQEDNNDRHKAQEINNRNLLKNWKNVTKLVDKQQERILELYHHEAENFSMKAEIERLKTDLEHKGQDTFRAVIAGRAWGRVNELAMEVAHRLKYYTELRKVEVIVNSTEQQDKIDELKAEIERLKTDLMKWKLRCGKVEALSLCDKALAQAEERRK